MPGHTARFHDVVEPRKHRSADEAIEKCPDGSNEAASERQVVTAVYVPEPGRVLTGPIKSHDPPGQDWKANPPDNAARQRKRFDVKSHLTLPDRSFGKQRTRDGREALDSTDPPVVESGTVSSGVQRENSMNHEIASTADMISSVSAAIAISAISEDILAWPPQTA
jgi:hypothetical protein